MKFASVVQVKRLSRIGFNDALQLQKSYRDKILHDGHSPKTKNYLLLLEHNPVYTVGLRSREYNEELEHKLKSLGAEFIRTDRGGLITFHGPGQLVAYPIISLRTFNIGMREYVSRLERSVIKTCSHYGIDAQTSEHTGVWVGDFKVAAIGVHGSRFVTTHGLALNCCTDLAWFDHIVPCGIVGKGVTSLSALLHSCVSVGQASEHFINSFSQVFQCDIVNDDDVLTNL